MTARTIVAWDGSRASRAALDWAVRSEEPDGELMLVHVTDAGSHATAASIDARLKDARTALENEAAKIPLAHTELHVRTTIVQGEAIHELRKLTGPDAVLVVGADVTGSLGLTYGWSMGSELAASAAGPVVIVPLSQQDDEGERPERAGVVVGVDGTEEAFAAAMFAADQAQRRNETLTVVHAWHEPRVWENAFVFDEEFVDSLEGQHEAVLAEAEQVIAEYYPALPITRSLLHGTASWSLLEAARDASLLVVGCRGHRGVKRLFLGSVSHSILLNITTPTAVIPHGMVDSPAPAPGVGGARRD
jgi:nucleotide-binding universal stress UspA family protein